MEKRREGRNETFEMEEERQREICRFRDDGDEEEEEEEDERRRRRRRRRRRKKKKKKEEILFHVGTWASLELLTFCSRKNKEETKEGCLNQHN
jgi:hypothetical protein